MRVFHKLQCEICGARSEPVDPAGLSERDKQMLREFTEEHRQCAIPLPGFSPEHAVAARPVDWTPPQCGAFGSKKAEPRSVPRPHGYFEYTGPYGEIQQGDTVSCCHCRHHHEARAGLQLGFCPLCYDGSPGSGVTCATKECQEHIPFEQRLENIEAGRPWLAPAPAKVAVPPLPGEAVILERTDGLAEASSRSAGTQ